MWQIQYSLDKPAELEGQYLRRNITQLDNELWQFEERLLSNDEYHKLRIQQLELENTNLQLALTELYENLLES